ncbi:MAG: hypothetical protein COA45_02455 [Zetaproteobacteria bacterium]|nr:MAG: hypothetical protein COA45_02455 [Zetaproteobacteria bacterium]
MEFITELLADGYTWYTFSFLIFAAIIIKVASPIITKALDSRIEDIKRELEESENLRVEAQEMLAQYQRKHRDAVQESEKIIKTARENSEQFKAQAEADLDEIMKRREQQLENRLQRMEQNAISEIQAYAADLAMNAATQIIIDKLDKKANSKLVEQSIENVEINIH